ncbi:MAG TPA: hypothetical protein VMT50_11215 [Steroidobacteraceae bacterium]|nr:hypothetical protein [Steroidobacteraceae bacterium]
MKSPTAPLWSLIVALVLAPAAFATAPPLAGEVLETIDGGQYTYLRLKTKDGENWAAVLHADVKKGAQVTIDNPMVMANFESKTLHRTFDKIIFGTLAGTGSAAAAGGAMPPPGMGAQKPREVAVVPSPKASGPEGRTVAEVHSQQAALKGKTVAVRGTVVKFLPGIMGKNWVHLRDGTGVAADESNDLTVTTKGGANPGDVVTARGVVRTNVDLGMGMSFKILVEDATLTK